MVYLSYVLMTLLGIFGIFLIGLILLQRGRGGGLAGAFGGMGGQSAFGTKAGDVFTRITIGVAAAWIVLCASSVLALHYSTGVRTDTSIFKQQEAVEAPKKAEPKTNVPADGVEFNPNAEEAPIAPAPTTQKPGKEASVQDKAGGETKKAPEKNSDSDESKKGGSKPDDNGDPRKNEIKSKDNGDGEGKTDNSKPESKPQ